MADHVVRDGGFRILRALLGLAAALVVGGATVLAAIGSFDVNPVGPALVALFAIAGGVFLAARTHDLLLRGVGFGLVAGGLIAVLLWPLFAVD
jgi:hypothetical protein